MATIKKASPAPTPLVVKNANPDRVARMTTLRAQIAKKFGDEAVVDMEHADMTIEAISTGSLLLDRALGVGGFPRGRLVELYGEESTGKSSLAIASAYYCQQVFGEPVLYLDFEHSFDRVYAARFGLSFNPDLFLFSQPTTLEEGMEIAEYVIEASAAGIVVVDSLAAMLPKQQLEGDVGDQYVAPQARAMSAELRRLTPILHRSNTCMLFINHTRDVIGGFNPSGQIRKTTPGGKALKFYSSVRIELSTVQKYTAPGVDPTSGKKVPVQVGSRHQARVVKNKVAPPYTPPAVFFLRNGICEEWTVLELAEQLGFVKKSGSFYTLPGADSGRIQGQQNAIDWLCEHDSDYRMLREQVIDQLDTLNVADAKSGNQVALDDEEEE